MTRTSANALLLVAAVIWGTAFVAQQKGMASVGPLAFTAARFALGALIVLPLAMREFATYRRSGAALSAADGRNWTTDVRYDSEKSDWHAYYRNVCDHLRDGQPLVITPESAGRVICVLDCANQSAAAGGQPRKPWLC